MTDLIPVMPRMVPCALLVSLSISWPVQGEEKYPKEAAPGVRQVGYLEDTALNESSGLVASRNQPGVFWTHNDGGNLPHLFAIDQQGKSLQSIELSGIVLEDWEDIAIDDEAHLYVADIGNNESLRNELKVHRVAEPSLKAKPRNCVADQSWILRFPGQPFDCESLVVHQNHGYVISKVFQDAKAALYRFPLQPSRVPLVLEFVAELPVTSPVTGADLSRDGALLGLVCKSGAFVFRVDGFLDRKDFKTLARARFKENQLEGCCFIAEGLLATSEERDMFLFHDPPFRANSR